MKDYCTCGFRQIDQTFLSGGLVYCLDCRQPICCDVVPINPKAVAPHPAEVCEEGLFACWPHWHGVAALAVAHAVAAAK